jgi:pimeloyl-ACP methyl ester carboxylesterase
MSQIKANGITIEYDELGPRDGVPYLIINGFGSQLTSWPDAWRQGLAAAGMRVVRFDNRDVGLTQKWDGIVPDAREVVQAVREGKKPAIPYTLSDMAADAAGLLDALGIDSAHVQGASMGGMIAQLMALEHPKKMRSLIQVFSTTGDRSLPPATPEAQAALLARPAGTDRASVIANALKGRRVYASTAHPFDEAHLSELIGANYDRSYYPEGTSRQYAAIVAAEPRTERLKSLKVPALILHGTADTLIPAAGGRHSAEVIPGAEYHEIEGWGHDMPLPAIPVVQGLILPFVKKVEAARAKTT